MPERSDGEWLVPIHGGRLLGGLRGNKHALKHGRYNAEAIASGREVVAQIRHVRCEDLGPVRQRQEYRGAGCRT
jgi:hypothetical protein